MWNKKKLKPQAHRYRKQIGGMGEMGQKVQNSSCKINKSSGCNVQHGDYVNNTVLQISKLLRQLSKVLITTKKIM